MTGRTDQMADKELFFFIGTEAELIKLFPVMIELKKLGRTYHIIASGQNNIRRSEIFTKSECGKIELELSEEKDIKKTAAGLLSWWFATCFDACKRIREAFPGCGFRNSYMIVHGDTVSTYMGARVGKKLGMTVCHIEAGLRSHNLFNPFPEEIDRLLTSRVARKHFAPGEYAVENLKKAKGEVINTEANTLIDALSFSEKIDSGDNIQDFLQKHDDYFVFVIHRQENISNTDFFRSVLNAVRELADRRHCLFILHEITRIKLTSIGEMRDLETDTRFSLFPRVQYFDFMKLLKASKFVITDGGSNQEELFYMGKPCLLLRKTTERKEGLGENAVLIGEEGVERILLFGNDYERYNRALFSGEYSPSRIIVDNLQ